MDPRAQPFANLLRLNAHLLANCVDGLSDDEAQTRIVPSLNSVAFLVAHLTDVRHTLLTVLGGSAHNPLSSHLDGANGIDDIASLPPLPALLDAWLTVDAALAQHLASMPAAAFDAPSGRKYPGGDPSVLGALAFLVQHDSYHIGQLALLRRAFGLPAMQYGASTAVRSERSAVGTAEEAVTA
jgi:uncharacterized damage-inducible protein DinB